MIISANKHYKFNKAILIAAISIIAAITSVSCSSQTKSTIGTPDIVIQSPMTISNSECAFKGETVYLRLKMMKGRYYEDWNPGAIMGSIREGQFSAELADETDKTIAITDISSMYDEPLVFNSTFDLEFDDYNNDGDPDFTIGQYGSSNGNLYRIFTLRKNGKIEPLPVKDHTDLFISSTTGYYSTQLNKIDATSFEVEYYDNTKGTFDDTYKWDGKQFVRTGSVKAN